METAATKDRLVNLIESMSPYEQEKLTEQGQFGHLCGLIDCLSSKNIAYDSGPES